MCLLSRRDNNRMPPTPRSLHGLKSHMPFFTQSSLKESQQILTNNPFSQQNHSPNSGAHDPVPRVLKQHVPRGAIRLPTTARTVIRPIR